MASLDAALRVLAVQAHVPLTRGAVAAGHGVGSADDGYHPVPGGEVLGTRRHLRNAAQGFVADDQVVVAGGCLAILALHDLGVCPVQAHLMDLDQHLTVPGLRVGDLFQPSAARLPGGHNHCSHDPLFPAPAASALALCASAS